VRLSVSVNARRMVVLYFFITIIDPRAGAARTRNAATNISSCAAELKLPVFSSLARSTDPSVTVTVRLDLDSGGKIQKYDFEGGTGVASH
jgi:hypothetical protein